MFQTLRNAWKIEDLRKKLLFTLLILVIVRLGCAIPVPFLDPSRLQEMLDSTQGNLLGYLNLLTGGAFAEATLFALGVSPYITASIVIQLLTVAIPSLERMAKEGPEGQKKIKKITRYSTIGLAILQAYAYYTLLRSSQFNAVKYTTGAAAWISGIAIVLAFSAGAMLVVWLGERIDEKGIGNGISLILFAGIVARIPTLITRLITGAERRIPVQYAKRIVGRKQYGGQNTYMPIKVNMSGVLPIIFASTFLAIPGTIVGFVDPNAEGGFAKFISNVFSTNSIWYAILYFILIILFNYFYIAIQYNPIEMANNIRKNNGAIPGIRPGKPTSDFISRIISKTTLTGALMLAVIAILPIILGAVANMNISMGGTSIIIVVGVALDTARSLESQMMMRHYKGFLE